MVDSFIRHGAPELVKQFSKNWDAPAALKPLFKTLNPETVEALAKSANTADGELLPQTINQIADEAVVNPENARRGLGFFQDGIQNKDWKNYGAWQGDLEKKWNLQTQRDQIKAQVPEKEAGLNQIDAPTRYDVEGVEGRRSVEQAARPWFDEQLERIGWDPQRTGEIDRSQFAKEGIYVDGEKFNFAGLTKYAKDRKSFPKLRPAQRSASKLDRASNELVQTMGPAIRAKPQLVDIMGEVVPEKDVHKHHVLLLKIIEPWTRKSDGSIRDKKQIKQLITALSKRDWWIGNTDKNLVWQNIATHFGDPSSSHGLLKTFTDIQGRGVSESKELAAQTGKTYDPKAMHGFSNEFIRDLSKETNTKKLIKSLLMFLEEGGGGEAMEGAAYSATKNLEPKPVIKKTGNIKEVESGDILAERRGKNPRVKKNVERFEKGISTLKK